MERVTKFTKSFKAPPLKMINVEKPAPKFNEEPVVSVINAVQSKYDVPGEIDLGREGRLLQEFLQYDGLTKQIIDAYDYWVCDTLPRRLNATAIHFSLGTVKFEDITIMEPTMILPGSQTRVKQYPHNARRDKTTYAISIYGTMKFYPKGSDGISVTATQEENFKIGEIPVILGSRYCNLYGLTAKQLIEKGECDKDPFAYFIIEGQEKIVLQHDKLRFNKPFIFPKDNKKPNNGMFEETVNLNSKKTELSMIICRFTAMPTVETPMMDESKVFSENEIDPKKSTVVNLYYDLKTKALLIKLDRFIQDTYLNVFYLYELYGVSDMEIVKQMIMKYVPEIHQTKIMTFLNKGEMDYHMRKDIIAVLKGVMKLPEKIEKLPTQKHLEYYQEKIGDVFFKQIEGPVYATKQEKYNAKLEMLSIMIARFSEYQTNCREADHRDSWSNKRVVSAGPAMEHLFNQIWNSMIMELNEYLSTVTVNERTFEISGAIARIPTITIKDTFVRSFNPNTWGIQQSIMKENMTDFLKNETLLAKYSQILKISPETSDKGKQTSIREVNFTQTGYICPIETPEGKQCGIVKGLAVGCYISIGRDENVIVQYVRQSKLVSQTQNSEQDCAFILNGKFIGWCEGRSCESELKKARRSTRIHRDTMIYFEEPRILWVYCDGGRPTRPLLIVNQDTGKLVIEEKDLWDVSFYELLKHGAVEYIDALEQEFSCVVAQSISLFEEKSEIKRSSTSQRDPYSIATFREIVDKQKYTHCEMDPNAIISLVASVIPMPERSQAPRNTYQTSMGKQALSIQNTNAINRFDTEVKSLAYPSPTLFETQMYKYIGLDELPIGETVMVAVMSYGGWNQEDSIIINQASVDRGRFRIVRTITYKTIQLSGNKDFVESIQKPIKKVSNADALDEDGVVRQGTYVRQGDCLIGKVKKILRTREMIDASVYVGVGDSGIVERVLKTTSAESRKIVMIKIREVRKIRAGDKLAMRYAQKGTIGIVMPAESMPVVMSGPNAGMTPDVIINPHCFTGDSQVGLYNGLSRKISSFSPEGCEMVWTIGDKGMVQRHSLGMTARGVKDIVQVTLLDGRKIRCTPDHKFVTLEDGQRSSMEAQYLNGKEVIMGLECVEDIIGEDERNWKLITKHYTFTMDTQLNRDKTLAFARILGYVLTDGTLSKVKNTEYIKSPISFGCQMDLDTILQDIHLITGKRPKCRKDSSVNGNVLVFNIPASLANSMGDLDEITIGRRTTQEANWPYFLLKENCPKSFLREFIAGLFGGDGHAPGLLHGRIVPIHFSNSICAEFIDSLKTKMTQLCEMMKKVGVDAKISRIRKTHSKSESYTLRPRLTCEIVVPNLLDFGKKIGFRYCSNKMCKLSAALGYVQLQENVRKQMAFVNTRTSELFDDPNRDKKVTLMDCLERARSELKEKECVLNEYYSLSNKQTLGNRRKVARSLTLKSFDYSYFPTFEKYLEQIGCLDWFKKHTYVNAQQDNFVSTYHMKVLDVRPWGQDHVFDIGVSEFHYFTVSSVCVQNCQPSRMTLGMMIEIMTSKVAAMTGKKVNATAFRKFDLDAYSEELSKYGFDRHGSETMMNGMTGEMFENQIFMGPCYYQALKHHVQDKIQQRGRGPVKITTRQPTAGRTRGGGKCMPQWTVKCLLVRIQRNLARYSNSGKPLIFLIR
jgi:DNA-directed RNA polymerase II subunit RPB2